MWQSPGFGEGRSSGNLRNQRASGVFNVVQSSSIIGLPGAAVSNGLDVSAYVVVACNTNHGLQALPGFAPSAEHLSILGGLRYSLSTS